VKIINYKINEFVFKTCVKQTEKSELRRLNLEGVNPLYKKTIVNTPLSVAI